MGMMRHQICVQQVGDDFALRKIKRLRLFLVPQIERVSIRLAVAVPATAGELDLYLAGLAIVID